MPWSKLNLQSAITVAVGLLKMADEEKLKKVLLDDAKEL